MLSRISSSLSSAALGFSLLVATCGASAFTLSEGEGRFGYSLPGSDQQLDVYTYLPDDMTPKSPIVMVMHGSGRNAQYNRDAWAERAEEYGFVVIAPEFDKQDYPGSRSYHRGNLVDRETEQPNPPEEWSYSVIEPLFEDVAETLNSTREGYYLFGHSAGCQVAHRLLTFEVTTKVEALVCSAPGVWTLPDDNMRWHFGLKDDPLGVDTADLADFFAMPALIMVGEDDDNPNHSKLANSSSARALGANRLERAINYFETSAEQAERLEVPFNWNFYIVPDADHSTRQAAEFAADQVARFERGEGFVDMEP
ncbi:alpha/beta hydrolase [Halomonas stenophila]|uniref:Pimeloyl-ACP methyl ester carboxylesterase n=1 Tax=Halomonas stenophila TaxID=795312 RepID=A0A7W5ETY3_9GAMM|nr:hypothetical protein [Halomonas stenophila]MBB3231291.1 pimeloyl-ACP methyl ester carboxylesterase [Halomonas stenophila]